MLFSTVGNLVEGTTGLLCGAMENGHRALDDTLDGTGLSAFIPHAVHEVSDGAQGLVKRGLDDFGRTTGAVLRSFDQHNLHGSDKSLGYDESTLNIYTGGTYFILEETFAKPREQEGSFSQVGDIAGIEVTSIDGNGDKYFAHCSRTAMMPELHSLFPPVDFSSV